MNIQSLAGRGPLIAIIKCNRYLNSHSKLFLSTKSANLFMVMPRLSSSFSNHNYEQKSQNPYISENKNLIGNTYNYFLSWKSKYDSLKFESFVYSNSYSSYNSNITRIQQPILVSKCLFSTAINRTQLSENDSNAVRDITSIIIDNNKNIEIEVKKTPNILKNVLNKMNLKELKTYGNSLGIDYAKGTGKYVWIDGISLVQTELRMKEVDRIVDLIDDDNTLSKVLKRNFTNGIIRQYAQYIGVLNADKIDNMELFESIVMKKKVQMVVKRNEKNSKNGKSSLISTENNSTIGELEVATSSSETINISPQLEKIWNTISIADNVESLRKYLSTCKKCDLVQYAIKSGFKNKNALSSHKTNIIDLIVDEKMKYFENMKLEVVQPELIKTSKLSNNHLSVLVENIIKESKVKKKIENSDISEEIQLLLTEIENKLRNLSKKECMQYLRSVVKNNGSAPTLRLINLYLSALKYQSKENLLKQMDQLDFFIKNKDSSTNIDLTIQNALNNSNSNNNKKDIESALTDVERDSIIRDKLSAFPNSRLKEYYKLLGFEMANLPMKSLIDYIVEFTLENTPPNSTELIRFNEFKNRVQIETDRFLYAFNKIRDIYRLDNIYKTEELRNRAVQNCTHYFTKRELSQFARLVFNIDVNNKNNSRLILQNKLKQTLDKCLLDKKNLPAITEAMRNIKNLYIRNNNDVFSFENRLDAMTWDELFSFGKKIGVKYNISGLKKTRAEYKDLIRQKLDIDPITVRKVMDEIGTIEDDITVENNNIPVFDIENMNSKLEKLTWKEMQQLGELSFIDYDLRKGREHLKNVLLKLYEESIYSPNLSNQHIFEIMIEKSKKITTKKLNQTMKFFGIPFVNDYNNDSNSNEKIKNSSLLRVEQIKLILFYLLKNEYLIDLQEFLRIANINPEKIRSTLQYLTLDSIQTMEENRLRVLCTSTGLRIDVGRKVMIQKLSYLINCVPNFDKDQIKANVADFDIDVNELINHLMENMNKYNHTDFKEINKSEILPKVFAFRQFLSNGITFDNIDSLEYTTDTLAQIVSHMKVFGLIPKKVVIKVLEDSIFLFDSLPNILQLQYNHMNLKNYNDKIKKIETDIKINANKSHVDIVNNLKMKMKNIKLDENVSYTVVGDTHGQFFDFLQVFESSIGGGMPTSNNVFIINGDMVDRGNYSFEIMFLLLFMKLTNRHSVHILRGNHETTLMNEQYGFADEIIRKYDEVILEKFRDLFQKLPIGAVLEKKVMVIHGGLGRLTAKMTIKQLDQINRKAEPGEVDDPLSELLWSDPRDDLIGTAFNGERGGGCYFGDDITKKFLNKNNLALLVRSHEVCMQGSEELHDGKCITVFSAPNYCGVVGNEGAVLRFENGLDMSNPKVVKFQSIKKPTSQK
eukprot:gene7232-9863_t